MSLTTFYQEGKPRVIRRHIYLSFYPFPRPVLSHQWSAAKILRVVVLCLSGNMLHCHYRSFFPGKTHNHQKEHNSNQAVLLHFTTETGYVMLHQMTIGMFNDEIAARSSWKMGKTTVKHIEVTTHLTVNCTGRSTFMICENGILNPVLVSHSLSLQSSQHWHNKKKNLE